MSDASDHPMWTGLSPNFHMRREAVAALVVRGRTRSPTSPPLCAECIPHNDDDTLTTNAPTEDSHDGRAEPNRDVRHREG